MPIRIGLAVEPPENRPAEGSFAGGVPPLKHWSSTQRKIALSSQEAELDASTKALCEAIGIQSLAADFNIQLKVRLHVDAQAVFDLAHKVGLGKARHVQTCDLWIQEGLADQLFEIRKISGKVNPADALTKPLDGKSLEQCMSMIGFSYGAPGS